VIRANGGFIDKYIGDAVMALFPRAPGDALAAAVELLRRMGPYNAGRRRAGYEPIRIGIGAHHGPLILGTIGEAERMQTTVISDTVNVAARLEGLTKTFGVDLLVSGSILDGRAQPERFHLRHLGAVKAKGKTASVEVYECFDLDPPELIAHKLQTAPLFAQALAEFGRGTFLTAGRLFQRVAAANPSDGPAAHYRDRCSLFAVRGTGVEKWDGADLIETK
jgi:two-component system sensor histidine kinase ChiS